MGENWNKWHILGAVFALVLVVVFLGSCVASCSDDGDNPAYDPDGFLGYSDDFWEWSSKQ